jgi:hypothetical protein
LAREHNWAAVSVHVPSAAQQAPEAQAPGPQALPRPIEVDPAGQSGPLVATVQANVVLLQQAMVQGDPEQVVLGFHLLDWS